MDLKQRIHEETEDGESTDTSELVPAAPEKQHKGCMDKGAF